MASLNLSLVLFGVNLTGELFRTEVETTKLFPFQPNVLFENQKLPSSEINLDYASGPWELKKRTQQK